MNDPKTCAVLVPVARDIEPETQEALSELVSRGYDVRLLRGCSQVDLARSILASQALRDGFAETLWIDSDVVFSPDDVETLRAHNLPITAGLYVKKGRPEFACKFAAGTTGLVLGPAGGLLEIHYAAMGFTHVRREVYEAVAEKFALPACGGGYDPAKPVIPFFTPMTVQEGDGRCYLSEDYSFCFRAKACGFKVMADTRIKLGHVGRRVLTWDELAAPPSVESDVSAKLYEQLGRKQELIDEQNAAYTALLQILAGVASGEIEPGRVTVDLASRRWVVAPVQAPCAAAEAISPVSQANAA